MRKLVDIIASNGEPEVLEALNALPGDLLGQYETDEINNGSKVRARAYMGKEGLCVIEFRNLDLAQKPSGSCIPLPQGSRYPNLTHPDPEKRESGGGQFEYGGRFYEIVHATPTRRSLKSQPKPSHNNST